MPFPPRLSLLGTAALVAGCAALSPSESMGPPAKETVFAVTPSNQLIKFNAGQPQKILDKRALTGLRAGDTLLGIDFRVAKGWLYGLGASGQLYRIEPASAAVTAIGTPVALPAGREWGVDFNPVADRIRVVSDAGFNLRLHPDTGAVVDGDAEKPGVQFDGTLHYADGHAAPRIVAAAYTYNKDNDKITTNFALDGAEATLVHQGTKEGVAPAVSFNTGKLWTVGKLGVPAFEHATFDISDLSNAAYAGIGDRRSTRWYRIDLATGRAGFIGTVGGGEAIVGSAIEP